MTTETPKLLTEAEAEAICNKTPLEGVRLLRERGLIAPEPVDPLLIEAREIAASYYDEVQQDLAANMRRGICDDQPSVVSALAALRRGMELAPRKELTREMVREAVIAAKPEMLETSDFILRQTETCRREAEGFVARLHAAIQEALQ